MRLVPIFIIFGLLVLVCVGSLGSAAYIGLIKDVITQSNKDAAGIALLIGILSGIVATVLAIAIADVEREETE